MGKKGTSRYKEDPNGKKKISTTPRDLLIFYHLYMARVLNTDQIFVLVNGRLINREKPQEGSTEKRNDIGQGLSNRLKLLFDDRYIKRLRGQYHKYDPETSAFLGGLPLIYTLASRGARKLAESRDDPLITEKRWIRRSGDRKQYNVEHSLMCSWAYTALQFSLPSAPNLDLREWFPDKMIYDSFWLDQDGDLFENPSPHTIRQEDLIYHSIAPDSAFTLGRTDIKGTRHFLIEADRSTERPIERFTDKIKAYIRWKRHGKLIEKRRQRFRFDDFTVLTVTTTEERLKSLCQATAQIPGVREEPYLFRFACQKEYLSNPVRFRKRIWLTPFTDTLLNLQE